MSIIISISHMTMFNYGGWRKDAFSRITELVSGTFVATAQAFSENYCHVLSRTVMESSACTKKCLHVETTQSSLLFRSLEQGL